jgi:deazaflavin-dependent oxidoreductase (nitroreductase family)
MSTSPPSASDAQRYRALNRRMAETILGAEPEPYRDGGYVRRVVEVRGRRSGQVHAVPIAVVGLAGRRYLVSPVRDRNWVRNVLADPAVVVRSRDDREPARATPVADAERIADVVSTYVALMTDAPWALAQFPFPADASRERITQAADGLAVFELEPA